MKERKRKETNNNNNRSPQDSLEKQLIPDVERKSIR